MLSRFFPCFIFLYGVTFMKLECAQSISLQDPPNEREQRLTKASFVHQSHSRSKRIRNNVKLLKEALKLNENGYSLLEPYLDTDDLTLYETDSAYIAAFPFSSYKETKVINQGDFLINNIDDTIKNQLRKRIPWELLNKSIIEQYVKKGTIALDIGAHIGTHTITMSQCVGSEGKVFAFEPSKQIYRELCYNAAMNNCQNIYPIRCALGKDKAAIEVVSSHPKNEGGSYVINLREGTNAAMLLPLDLFNFDNISFIKIDVENMEADVLDGGEQTILRNRPIILIEIQGNGERPVQLGEDTKAMALKSFEKIKKLGYTLAPIGNASDYLAIPY